MRLISLTCFLLQFFFLFTRVKAQVSHVDNQPVIAGHYVIKTYGINEGLPSKNTTAALKDKRGFIWVGTENGLCKFDGYSFKIYVNIPGDTT